MLWFLQLHKYNRDFRFQISYFNNQNPTEEQEKTELKLDWSGHNKEHRVRTDQTEATERTEQN